MDEVDKFSSEYAARHYRYHADRGASRGAGHASMATTRIIRKTLSGQARRPRLRRPAIFVAGISIAFLFAVPFLTRDRGTFPYQPGFATELRIIHDPSYSYAVDGHPERGVPIWMGYRLVPIQRNSPGGKTIEDERVGDRDQLSDDVYEGYDRAKMFPARHSGNLAESDLGDLLYGTLVAPHHEDARNRIKDSIDDWLFKKALNEQKEIYVVRGPFYGSKPKIKGSFQIPDGYFCVAISEDGTQQWLYENRQNPGNRDTSLTTLETIEDVTELDFGSLPGRSRF